ncbi:MAG: hypothetical protein methR_P1651 [Methyloprofundus sp.]|nr:MAG: hypothetical protein methR_P1651 [Methyloprofundus sp.]
MSSFLPIDKDAKTVVIPVSIKDGKIEYYGEGEMPKMHDVSIADLIVPGHAFKDRSRLKEFMEEKTELILKSGERLLVQIAVKRENSLDKHFLTYFESVREMFQALKDIRGLTNPEFVEIELLDDLKITLRGTKKATLSRCKCKIPILNNVEAYSLNHAYTLISQEFEKHRISHSGNVFKDIYYKKDDNKWLPIDSFRDALES